MKGNNKLLNEEINKYYKDRDVVAENDANRVGWKSEFAQIKRFEQLVKIINDVKNFSIIDLGCGLGSFLGYLIDKGYSQFRYTGYDLDQEMIEKSKRKNDFPQAEFIQIKNTNEIKRAEYIIASGIFNLKYSVSEADWLYYILSTIQTMNENSIKGFSFNALTKYSDKEFMRPELFYADPLFLFDFCKRNFSRNVALLHDYEEYDFTILVRKE